MSTNEVCAAEKRYELRKRFFVEFASVASNTADIEYLSAPRFDFGIDKCNRVFHFTNFVIPMRWQDIEATVHIAVIARTDHTVLIGRGRPIIPIIRPLLHPEIRHPPPYRQPIIPSDREPSQ